MIKNKWFIKTVVAIFLYLSFIPAPVMVVMPASMEIRNYIKKTGEQL